jgi:hypothetical protein
MNDPIKYMVVGAVIAVSSAAISGVVVGWSVSETASTRPKSVQPSVFPATLPAEPARFKWPAQPAGSILPPGKLTLPAPASVSTNITVRPPPMAQTPISYNEFQKLQEVPEVKKAREEFMEAQKRYSETMKKAMGKPEVRDQRAEVSGKAGSSNQYSVNSGQKK